MLDVPNIATASTDAVKDFTERVRESVPCSDAQVLFAALAIFTREYDQHDHGSEPNEEDFGTVTSELWALAACLNLKEGRAN